MPGHVFAQHGVDERLPAATLLLVGGNHIRVKAKGLVDLAGFFRWAASAAPKQFFRSLRADKSRQHFSGRAGTRHVIPRPFRVVGVRA